MDGIERTTLSLLNRAMDAAALQHQLHVINLTHVNDPSHSPLRLRFIDAMNAATDTSTSVSEAAAGNPEVYRLVGQKVQVDTEIAMMAGNATHYQALANGVSRHLALYAIALNEGK